MSDRAPSDVVDLARLPESDGNVRAAVLDAARDCFAEMGYEGTSVGAVAVRGKVGLDVVGRLYATKRELYFAVFDHAEGHVVERLGAAVGTPQTFEALIGAVFDEVLALSDSDPGVIRFLGTVSSDLAQNAGLREEGRVQWPRQRSFLEELVGIGVVRGEVAVADRLIAVDMLLAMMVGLWHLRGLHAHVETRAVEGFKRLLAGGLVAVRVSPN